MRQYHISIQVPGAPVRSVPIKARVLTIGRGAENDLVLDDPNVDEFHARLDFDRTHYQVTDLDSDNGTLLAGAGLLPGMPEVWRPDNTLRIGDTVLRLKQGPVPDKKPVEKPSVRRFGVSIKESTLSVEPGGSTTVSVAVFNQGSEVEHPRVSIEGIPAEWLPSPPLVIPLMPGQQQEATLTIQPPRSPQSRAGRYPITVRVSSQDEVAEVKGTLTVAAYSQFSSRLYPEKIRAGQVARVTVQNQGNIKELFTIDWQDRGDELTFEPPKTQLGVPAGQEATARFRAAPRRRRWIGGEKNHPLTAQVSLAKGKPQTHSGEVVSRALILAWVPPLVTVPLIALCLFLGYLFTKAPVIQSITVDPPNPEADQPVTVHWRIDNAESIELRPLLSGLDPSKGGYTFEQGFPSPTNLTVVASNSFGSVEKPLTIPVVVPTPTPTPEPGTPVLEEWSVVPTEVIQGQSVIIKWRVSNAESVKLHPFGTVDNAGEKEDRPQETKIYTLIATNKGKTMEKSQEVVVRPPPIEPPKVMWFTVEPSTLVKGQVEMVHLKWDTEKADIVMIEPSIGQVGLAGSRDVSAPLVDTEYTLVAKNAGGETKRQAQVRVEEPLCTVVTGKLNLRPGPGTVYEPPIKELPGGTELKPLAFNSTGYPEPQWIQVEVQGTGEKGWVRFKESYVVCNLDVSALPEGKVPLAVTSVKASAYPPSFTGECPKTFELSANIKVNGPGTVTYRWELSDGTTGPTENITFAEAGSQQVNNYRWTLDESGSHWVRVRILEPKERESDQASFTLACPKYIYDFIDQAPLATWRSNYAKNLLSWGGPDTNRRGFAMWRENFRLEDGSRPARVLEMHPEWIDNGHIFGEFILPEPIQAGDRFRAKVGFLQGAGGSVKFCVVAWRGYKQLDIVAEVADSATDGQLRTIDADLTPVAGGDAIALWVFAGPSAAQDWAVWVDARIER